MGVGQPSFHHLRYILTSSGPRGLERSAPLVAVPVGVEVSSPFEDQGVRLAPSRMVSDDEVSTTSHGPGLPHEVLVVRRGSGGLLALVLCLPPGPSGMVGGGCQPPHGDFGGDILAIPWQRNIPSRS